MIEIVENPSAVSVVAAGSRTRTAGAPPSVEAMATPMATAVASAVTPSTRVRTVLQRIETGGSPERYADYTTVSWFCFQVERLLCVDLKLPSMRISHSRSSRG